MAILSKGHTFGATDQVTSTKLNNLVDASAFVSGGSGTCVSGGGLEVTTGGQLQVKDDDLDFAKLSDDAALTSGRFGIMNIVYPVGTIYQSTTQSSTPDALFFGGTGLTTWAAVGEGRVLVGKASSGTFGSAGATGGAETITLTKEQSGLPSHFHEVGSTGSENNEPFSAQSTKARRNHEDAGHTSSVTNNMTQDGETKVHAGADAASSHSNLQPYEVVYMWKRTA